jgi:hypothetical protein
VSTIEPKPPRGWTVVWRVTLAIGIAGLAVLAWRGNVFDIRAGPPFGSVAVAFDDPIPHPGFTWTRDGQRVSQFELVTIAGPDHCGWQTATVMFIAWPPGTTAPDSSHSRQYVRDPRGVMLRVPPFDRNVVLPPDAKPTGHRLGAIQLHVSPTDADRWIYVVGPSDAERWPRVDPMVLCA